MADQFKISVPEYFYISELKNELVNKYEEEGYNVDVLDESESSFSVKIEKDMGGFLQYLGLAKAITVNVELEGDKIAVDFTNPEWTGKIVAGVVGLCVILIPLITAIVGAIGQMNFPNEIGDHIRKIVKEMKNY